MQVRIPSPLRSYTAGSALVSADGKTVADVLADLDRQYPGIRFRAIDEQGGIRQHIKLFVNNDLIHNTDVAVTPKDTLHIVAALSGG